MTCYMVAGSQADKKSENKLYVMKWSEMYKTVHEDEIESDMDSDEEDAHNGNLPDMYADRRKNDLY